MQYPYFCIDNFLEDHVAKRIHDVLYTSEFAWYYHNVFSDYEEEIDDKHRYQFVHCFKSNKLGTTSNLYDQIALPITDKLQINYSNVIRCKVNMSLYSGKPYTSAWHIDNAEPHKVALYYVNTNNGYTELETGQKIECVHNRIVIFDGLVKHRAIKQTDKKTRVAINFNYE